MRRILCLLFFGLSGLLSCSQETREERMFSLNKVDSSLKTQIHEVSKAIQRYPTQASWYLKRARLYLSANQINLAYKDLSQSTKLDPSLGEAYFLKSKILVARGQYQESVKMMMQAKAFNFQSPEIEAVLAESYVGLQLYSRALTYSKKALELRPGEPKYYVLLAQAQAGSGDTTQAMQNLMQALRRDSVFLPAFRQLTAIYSARQQFDEALPLVQTGLKAQPKDSFWWFHLGQNFLAQRQTDTAMAVFTKTLEMTPGHAGALAGMGEGWYKKRQYSLALDSFLKAQQAGYTFPEQEHYHLAAAYEWTGQREAAKQQYVILIKKYPLNPRYPLALRRITTPVQRFTIDSLSTRTVF